MSHIVDDVININYVTFKILTGGFTRESIRDVMILVKDAGAGEESKLFNNMANHKIFLTFETNEGMFNWMKRCYGEGKK
jgi:hypothetical protein